MMIWRTFRGDRPDNSSFESHFRASLELFSTYLWIIEGNKRQAGKLFRIVAHELSQPVVINPETGLLKIGFFNLEEDKTEGGIENSAIDAIELHVLKSSGRIPPAWQSTFETL